jgi:hypothetical protein
VAFSNGTYRPQPSRKMQRDLGCVDRRPPKGRVMLTTPESDLEFLDMLSPETRARFDEVTARMRAPEGLRTRAKADAIRTTGLHDGGS